MSLTFDLTQTFEIYAFAYVLTGAFYTRASHEGLKVSCDSLIGKIPLE